MCRLVWSAIQLNHGLFVDISDQTGRKRSIERQEHMDHPRSELDHRKFLLFALVKAKLSNQPGSLLVALDAFSKACDLTETMLPRQYLLPAARLLVKDIRNNILKSHAADKVLYDKFIEQYSAHVPEIDHWKSFDQGSLCLFHPSKPSAKQAAATLLPVLDSTSDVDSRAILARFGNPKVQSTQFAFFAYVSRVVSKLQEERDLTTASNLMTETARRFHAFADTPNREALLQKQHDMQRNAAPKDVAKAAPNSRVLPFATFGHFASEH